ncbi:LTA4H [Bugula neritina]|uniref:LTA4H n=1 Tax=Bugula neritina TaxID=10212 RepID=A0A7J7KLR9_BUGNE|nr:LTA4H [Bugula neritina]
MNSGWTDLAHTIKEFGPTNPLTKLVLDLTDGTHPEDSFSLVPYEKGCAFLYTIEAALGGAAVVEPWLRAYIQKFKGKSIKTDEWKEFLYSYFSTEEQDAMPVERILQMGDLYELPKSNNAEIVSRWYQLCLRGRTRNQLDPTLQFVTDVGRMKFVRPLYQDMYAFEDVRQIAIDAFETNRPNMHPQTAAMVAKDLHLE